MKTLLCFLCFVVSAHAAVVPREALQRKVYSTGISAAPPIASPINVQWFGAKGDGTTDDTSAIQAALTAAYNAGGTIVFFPSGEYKVTGTLTCYQNITIQGEGYNITLGETKKATLIQHTPSSANTDCLIVKRDPAGQNPSNFCDFEMRDIAFNGSANSRDGVYIQNGRVEVSNVFIRTFSGKGLRLKGLIASFFHGVRVIGCDYGLYFDDNPVTTSTTFTNCTFSDHRICVSITHVNSVSFLGYCVFESSDEHAIEINNSLVELVNPYFEDIGREAIKAGFSSSAIGLSVIGGVWIDGLSSDVTYPVISLDDVKKAILLPMDMRVDKRALVQTTTNTGPVMWTEPAKVQATSASARANSTAYAKGAKFQVVCDDGITRIFQVVTAGTTAGAQPAGYSYYNLNKTDGTCAVSSYGPFIVFNQETLIQLGYYQGASGVVYGSRVGSEFKGNVWFMSANAEFGVDFRLTRNGATRRILYSKSDDDRVAIRMNDTDRLSPDGYGTAINDGAHIINDTADTRQVAQLEQRNNSYGFINFDSASAADLSRPVTTRTSAATLAGYVKVQTPMGAKWMPVYDDPP